MRTILFFIVGALLAFTACKKKDKEEAISNSSDTIKTDTVKSVVISDTDPSVTITDLNPPKNYYPAAHDDRYFPLDLNSDGKPDFKLYVIGVYTYGDNIFSTSTIIIETLTDNSYILSDSIFEQKIFNGQDSLLSDSTKYEVYPKVLSENNVIKGNDKWRSGAMTLLFTTYGYTPFSNTVPPEVIVKKYKGKWLNTDNKYIRLKCGNLCGWVKVRVDDKALNIYKYAVSKFY
jgi:hypothetical protein